MIPGSPTRSPSFVGDQESADSFEEMACLGYEVGSGKPIYINTHERFCLATIGAQGAERSHTLNCILESCLLPDATSEVSAASGKDVTVIRRTEPMTALVLHCSRSASSVCQAIGLLSPSQPDGPSVPRSKAMVLVSPTFYKQRKASYGDSSCAVVPLLFKWSSLTTNCVMRILRIGSSGEKNSLLDAGLFMPLLRRYQRRNALPEFSQFVQEMKAVRGLEAHHEEILDQQLDLLECMMAESEENSEIALESMDLEQALSSGLNLTIVDLTDPLLSSEDANTIFQVVTEQFRSISLADGCSSRSKLLILDEAHSFMDGRDGLSERVLVDLARQQHDGVRLVVSAESPRALAPKLLELVSATLLHHIGSQDGWACVKETLNLTDEDWLALEAGSALMVAPRSSLGTTHLTVRSTLTAGKTFK